MKNILLRKTYTLALATLLFISCSSNSETTSTEPPLVSGEFANIVSVTTSGGENNYTFSVGIKSPDKGCSQYANWWEVLSEDGTLIYRRILGHSHVNEQPFVRTGGAVDIAKNQIVIVRAHMNTSGYGMQTFKGSIDNGFISFTTEKGFATAIENQEPLPSGCAF